MGADSNNNQMSDIWEMILTRNSTANADSDGDGFSNFQESLAATGPAESPFTSFPRHNGTRQWPGCYLVAERSRKTLWRTGFKRSDELANVDHVHWGWFVAKRTKSSAWTVEPILSHFDQRSGQRKSSAHKLGRN